MATEDGVGMGPSSHMRHGFEDKVVQAVAVLEQYLPATASMVLNGRLMTQPEMVKALRDVLQLFTDLRAKRTEALTLLKTLRSELVPGHALYTAVARGMQAYFGQGNPVLARFGYALGQRKPRSSAANLKAQARAQLTRALRHTMGPRQKALIQATAPSVVTVGSDGTVQATPAPSQ